MQALYDFFAQGWGGNFTRGFATAAEAEAYYQDLYDACTDQQPWPEEDVFGWFDGSLMKYSCDETFERYTIKWREC